MPRGVGCQNSRSACTSLFRATPTGFWHPTGRIFAHALLALRPRRLTPPRAHPSELPIWKAAAILLCALALLVAFEITLAFLVAYLVTGRAY
jgi:hypothetical protein